MKIILEIIGEFLLVTLHNDSSNVTRIWKPENSWGWDNIEFVLKVQNDKVYHIKRSVRDWTYNFPGYIDLSAGEKYIFKIDLKDDWWSIENDIYAIKEETISIVAFYQIAPTSEAKQHNVAVVKLESNEVFSRPPHLWLLKNR